MEIRTSVFVDASAFAEMASPSFFAAAKFI
jgi:hypothetical protein